MKLDCENGPLHIMIDSTGLRVRSGNIPGFSPPRRRAWRKLHLVVDAGTGDVLTWAMTTHRAHDAAQVRELLSHIDHKLASVMATDAVEFFAVIHAFTNSSQHYGFLPARHPEIWP